MILIRSIFLHILYNSVENPILHASPCLVILSCLSCLVLHAEYFSPSFPILIWFYPQRHLHPLHRDHLCRRRLCLHCRPRQLPSQVLHDLFDQIERNARMKIKSSSIPGWKRETLRSTSATELCLKTSLDLEFTGQLPSSQLSTRFNWCSLQSELVSKKCCKMFEIYLVFKIMQKI